MLIEKFSKTGTYHKKAGIENQDCIYSMEDKDYIAIMLADGATGCSHGREGAEIACEAVKQIINTERNRFFSYRLEKISFLLLEHILYFLEQRIPQNEDIAEYGSTFSLAYMDKKTGRTVLVNLGDSAVIQTSDKGCSILSEPKRHHGSPCLTTTIGAENYVRAYEYSCPYGYSIMLCSDGFWTQLISTELTDLLNNNDLKNMEKLLSELETEDDCSYISFTRCRGKKGI